MPKRHLHREEWWPVLTLDSWKFWQIEAEEFTDEELADLKRVSEEWWAWQKKIAARFGVETMFWDYRIDQAKDTKVDDRQVRQEEA